MKRALKSAVQRVTAGLAPIAWRAARTPRLLVLMYHRVLPRSHPERAFEQPGMYVSPETLRVHLEALERHFTFMHLDQWIDRIVEGKPLPKHACAITFDDGWRDNYEYAYPLLRELGCPATVYLVSDLVGTSYAFWPNKLMRALSREQPLLPQPCPAWFHDLLFEMQLLEAGHVAGRRERIDTLIERCKNLRSDAEMMEIVSSLPSLEHEDRDLMNWSEIAEMASDDLVRFGSHSRRHTRLTERVQPGVLEDEILRSAEIIEEHLGRRPRTFCYPNGDHCARAVELVSSRYVGAVTTARGWNDSSSDRFTMRRVGVHDDVSHSRHQFLARIAGVG